MFIEMRHFNLKPQSLAAAEEKFGSHLAAQGGNANLLACWHAEIGPLNDLLHIWAFDNQEERAEQQHKVYGGNDAFNDIVLTERSELFRAAPFSPKLEPRQIGPVFEIRQYTTAPGSIPGMISRWSEKIAGRIQLSPLVGAWSSESCVLHKWVHIWAYRDGAERDRIRDQAKAAGIWPAKSPAGVLVHQENALYVPTSYSPIR
jgi:NIPSNAP